MVYDVRRTYIAAQEVDGDEGAVLGGVPHMIRGQLGGFQQTVLTGRAFSQCTACSATVVDAWRSHRWRFIADSLQARVNTDSCTEIAFLPTVCRA